MYGEGLTGNFRVRVFRPAFDEARRLLPRMRDRMELRAHALKLRYWPATLATADGGQVLDLDWSWVRAVRELRVGELRVDDVIGGQDNLRVLFYVDDRKGFVPLPVIWILWVMQKKRDYFSAPDLGVMRTRRLLVRERFVPGGN